MNRAVVQSYGGGTQSIAIIELILQGKLPRPERIVMADTGREATETWEYTERHVLPRMNDAGLKLELALHDLSKVDLYSTKGDRLLIPAFTKSGKLPTYCSNEWKKRVLYRYLRKHGYGPRKPVTMWMGISMDEIQRAGVSGVRWLVNDYPLLYHVPMGRAACVNLLLEADYPPPPKSSCWMCPFRGNAQWRRLRDHYPADFERAMKLDERIREKDPDVFVHRSARPLREVDLGQEVPELTMVGEECDSGHCFV